MSSGKVDTISSERQVRYSQAKLSLISEQGTVLGHAFRRVAMQIPRNELGQPTQKVLLCTLYIFFCNNNFFAFLTSSFY